MSTAPLRFLRRSLFLFAATGVLQAATTSLATAPLVSSSGSSVQPNILFVLDDSGSMAWDYLPDWANDNVNSSAISNYPFLFNNSDYNGVYYNPAVRYIPPTFYNTDGTLNTTTYPSMSGESTTTGGDSSASASARNWNAVKDDGYGVQSTTTSLLTNRANYWLIVPGEYCAAANLRSCNTQSSGTSAYPVAAKLRWCNSSALTDCKATWLSGSYTAPRIAAPANRATVGFSSSSNAIISGITVNGVQIMSGSTTASSTSTTVAALVADKINACTYGITGSCGVAGYKAVTSGATVTIIAPGANTYTPSVTRSGTTTVSTTAFSSSPIYSGTTVPGSNLLTVIHSSNNSYVYPNTTAKHANRTDCAGATCTYTEEMTNYANWWAYYRTRMQMMKTAVSSSFSTIDTSFRVGFLTISDGYTDSKFRNLATFDNTTKRTWYTTLFAAKPASWTPLRAALARAGRLFAGQLNGQSINGTTVTDPMQYSCQQNFTLLSTDGYWNTPDETGSYGPFRVSSDTNVGNADGGQSRPYSDGASYLQSTTQILQSQTQVAQSTSQLQKRTTQIQQRTTQIQQRTNTLQQVSGQLYTRTSSNSGSTWTDWASASSCTQVSTGTNRRQCMVGTLQTRTSSNSGSSWSAWSSVSSCTTDSSGTSQRQCQIVQNWTSVSACTPTRSGSSGSYSYTGGASAVDCQGSASSWSNVSSCTPAAPTECQTTDTGWVNASSCSPSGPSNGQTVTCQTTDTGWVGAGSCSAGTSGGQTITCQTAQTGPTLVASCTSATASSGNNYIQTTCASTTVTPATPVASCTAAAGDSGNNYVGTVCSTVNTGPTSVNSCTAEAASAANNYTTTTCAAGSGGVSDTLADVAMYYYSTDLRTSALGNCTGAVVPPASAGNDVCTDDVRNTARDPLKTQHMNTYTLGLGASGYMQYTPTYASPPQGDYLDVLNGSTANPAAGTCSWQNSGACNWPAPASDSQANIDDLWHAAVNGRGTYFSASNPATLADSLRNALSNINETVGASAAATTSTPNSTSGDNFLFATTYMSGSWYGDVTRRQIDLNTGLPASGAVDWSAQPLLDANASRTIYTFDSSASNKLKSFAWDNLTAEAAYFQTSNISTLSQFCSSGTTCVDATTKAAASGRALVDFLRGDRSNEGTGSQTNKAFRQREHLLGDVVDAEAAYVKKSLFEYVDRGYSASPTNAPTYVAFKTRNESRQGMVYVAANDGMLHAFNADNGNEVWAYVPSFVIPDLYRLADKNYTAQHRFFVDGTPVAAEICTANCATSATGDPTWKTILVGGLNGGGRGYYALDITDPSSPKALWEYSDTNLGYTYGNPEISKLADGTWVVMFASGYNNVSPGDGVGRLYILNAATGALIRTISTGVGTAETPSGLAKIRAWSDNTKTDNTALRVYGGDLLGNVWRFDINNTYGATGYDAQRLITLYSDAAGTAAQPITTRPELGKVDTYAVVFVGTGRYLGTPDLTDTSRQTMYAIKDSLGSTALGNPRNSATAFVAQTLTAATCPASAVAAGQCDQGEPVRTSSNNVVSFASNNGWYIDLPLTGERANVDPSLNLGTLSFNTNVPNTSVCTAGGTSYSNFVDYRTGAAVLNANTVVSRNLGNALATRGTIIRLPNNKIVQITQLSDGRIVSKEVPVLPGGGTTRRVSWRELVNE